MLYQKACDEGVMAGCAGLGDVAPDFAQAHSLYQKACDGGDMAGCIGLGNLYYLGHGVTLDYPKARSIYQKVCDSGETAGCFSLALLYVKGQGVTQDYAKARSLYQKACDDGERAACREVSKLQTALSATKPAEPTAHDEVEKIRLGPHASIPPAQRSTPSGAAGGRTTLTVQNFTAYELSVFYDGPVSKTLTLAPGTSQVVDLAPGTFHVAGRCSATNVLPFYGEETYAASASYSETFHIAP